MHLQGKVALVTGGAHRVGKAISMMLAQSGAHVVVNYNSSAEAAEQTVAEARALGVDGLALQCDVAEWASVQQMAAAITDRFGGVDVIVNGASYFGKTPFPSSEPEVVAMWHRGNWHPVGWHLFCLQQPCANHVGTRWRRHRQYRRSFGLATLAQFSCPFDGQGWIDGDDTADGAGAGADRSCECRGPRPGLAATGLQRRSDCRRRKRNPFTALGQRRGCSPRRQVSVRSRLCNRYGRHRGWRRASGVKWRNSGPSLAPI